jgi:hypothetical protein
MANVIEQAKSGRASCRICKKPIAKSELRLGIEAPNAFGDTPSMQWHHLLCAAGKLPAELAEALKQYPGTVPNRDELETAIGTAYTKGGAKPGGFPYSDRAPTGRAKCLQCSQPIEKDSFRVAIERHIEVGGMVQSGAGYLHPGCVTAYLEAHEGSPEDLIAALRANSRIPDTELGTVISAIA